MAGEVVERRTYPRTVKNEYYAVNFLLDGSPTIFHCLIWDMSPDGISLLMREDSIALKSLKVGDTLNMKYYKADTSEPPDHLKTRIRHITKDPQGRFEGYFLVGISTLEQQDLTRK